MSNLISIKINNRHINYDIILFLYILCIIIKITKNIQFFIICNNKSKIKLHNLL